MSAVVLRGDAASLPLPDGSVDLICTSPPYFGLRSYTDAGEAYDGQIGSEYTPWQYLEALWRCTAEWMRVLKPGGSIFVNLGDSYSSGHSGDDYPGCHYGPSHVGAPSKWTQANARWLAGVLDCEGSVSARVLKNDSGGESVVAWMRVTMMDRQVCDRISEITGVGRQFQDKRGAYTWNAASQQVRYVLERIWPYLLIKQRQALAAIELCRHVADRNARGAWSPLTPDDLAYRRRIVEAIRTWNKREDYPWEPPKIRPVALPHSEGGPGAKSLRDLPHRYAIGCVDDLGLIKRAEICWSKPNGLPESVQDRVRRNHEFLFHFTKQPRYFAALDEIRQAHAPAGLARRAYAFAVNDAQRASRNPVINGAGERPANPLGKLPGSVWEIPSAPLVVPAHLGLDHFAAFPVELPRRMILGWSPPAICLKCGEGRRPVVAKGERFPVEAFADRKRPAGKPVGPIDRGEGSQWLTGAVHGINGQEWNRHKAQHPDHVTGYACACTPYTDHPERRGKDFHNQALARERGMNAGDGGERYRRYVEELANPRGPVREYHFEDWTPPPSRPAVVVDPFGGTGTTALVADVLGRTGITVDRSMDYSRLARWRTSDPAERARALGVPKPPPVPDGQGSLFDHLEAS